MCRSRCHQDESHLIIRIAKPFAQLNHGSLITYGDIATSMVMKDVWQLGQCNFELTNTNLINHKYVTHITVWSKSTADASTHLWALMRLDTTKPTANQLNINVPLKPWSKTATSGDQKSCTQRGLNS
jgi:hypothetical protein